jgi:hypothetical protein
LLDDLVVVGGLVPSLLTLDESLPAGEDAHSVKIKQSSPEMCFLFWPISLGGNAFF